VIARAVLVVACLAGASHAGPLALGIQIGVPGQGSGLPMGDAHIPGGLTGHYALAPWRWATPALTLGIGTPIAGVGASVWGGLELRRDVVARFAVYVAPGLRTGFSGPGYYARHSDVFVGYAYNYAGPWTVAPRLPVGVVVSLGRAEAYVEALIEIPMLPSPQVLVGGGIGVRVSL